MLRSWSSAGLHWPCSFTLKVKHALILVECLFAMTLLLIHPEGKTCSDLGRVLVCVDLPTWPEPPRGRKLERPTS